MEIIELKTTLRSSSGNGPSRALRREGRIPAVLYGPNSQTVMLSVAAKELEQVIAESAGGNVLLNLIIQGGDAPNRSAMIKELQTHPVSRNFLHIDFYEIAMDRKITVPVTVVATGKSIGIEEGGILQIVRRELDVLCLPLEIPQAIEIDISQLKIGDAVHLDEIPLKAGLEFAEDGNFTVLTVVAPKSEEEAVEEAVEAEGVEGEALPPESEAGEED